MAERRWLVHQNMIRNVPDCSLTTPPAPPLHKEGKVRAGPTRWSIGSLKQRTRSGMVDGVVQDSICLGRTSRDSDCWPTCAHFLVRNDSNRWIDPYPDLHRWHAATMRLRDLALRGPLTLRCLHSTSASHIIIIAKSRNCSCCHPTEFHFDHRTANGSALDLN
jgi:hypothetical protein